MPEARRSPEAPGSGPGQGSAAETVAFEADYEPRIHYALEQNDVPLVALLRIRNEGHADLEDLQVSLELEGGHAAPEVLHIARLPSGSTFNWETPALHLDPGRLAAQRERERTRLRAQATCGDRGVGAGSWPVEILARNEWGGLHALPEMVAAFVQPNEPAVSAVLARARRHLERGTGDPSLGGYQAGDPRRVRAMAESVYAAVRDHDIGYVSPPPSYETHGQKVRTPGEILEHRLATCLDLALLLAACLEQVGLHPLLLFVEGHAFAGVRLHPETSPEPVVEDAARLRKRVKLGELAVFEATGVTARPPLGWRHAQEEAARHLEPTETFLCAVDIAAARRQRILPLPGSGSGAAAEARSSEPASDLLTSQPHGPDSGGPRPPAERGALEPAAPEPAPAPNGEAEEAPASRLERWKRRLLDLSLRNRLLNFRETKKTVRLMCPGAAELEDALALGRTFELHPAPALADPGAARDLEGHRRRTRHDALHDLLREDLAAGRLHARLDPEELQDRLTQIYRAARTSVEETGTSTLHLALGFLEWFETPQSRQPRWAPILLLPLEIVRRSVKEGFRLRLADDDPQVNVTLLEMLQAEFRIDIQGLDPLPVDEAGLDVGAVFNSVRAGIRNVDRWDVREEAAVGLFSFTKFLMWRDLDAHRERLLESPVVRHLVERPGEPFGDAAGLPQPEHLDVEQRPRDTCCPLDADSSQLAAVLAGAGDHSFVLQGPPGTGKSQTITNLIAQALSQGQRVLFVAEKLAALQVVYSRLEKVGLDPFCLELHSNRSSKRAVLGQLEEALESGGSRKPQAWERRTDRLEVLRRELNAWVEALHSPRPPGQTVFRATSELIGLRDVPHLPLETGPPLQATPEDMTRLRDLAARLETAVRAVGLPASHPLRGVGLETWGPGLAADTRQAARDLERALDGLEAAWAPPARALGLGADPSPAHLEAAGRLAGLMLQAPGVGRRLLAEPGWDSLRAGLEELCRLGRRRDALREEVLARYRSSLLDRGPAELRRRLLQARERLPPFSWFAAWSVRRAAKQHLRGGRPAGGRALQAELEAACELVDLEGTLESRAGEAVEHWGRLWCDGEPDWDRLEQALEWSGALRRVLPELADTAGGPGDGLRERVLDLVTSGSDALAPDAPLGHDLQGFLARLEDLDGRMAALEELLDLDREQAFGASREPGGFARLRQRSRELAGHADDLRDWTYWRRNAREAAREGLGPLVQACAGGTLAPERLREAFERSFLEAWLDEVTRSDERLQRFNSHEHARLVAQFAELDEEHMRLARDVVRARLATQVPDTSEDAASRSEVGILQRQLKLKRNHMSVRRLLACLPHLLPRLKPCFLMSPLSVAQYLEPGSAPFDLVIFDEASQIPVWDAVGALARGRRAVVVGDSKQLPPTTFFARLDVDDEEDADEAMPEVESILDECEAAGLPDLKLLWHYRSRHESLITFSNHHYYENRLLTFPAPEERSDELGVFMHHVADGVYDRGRSRTNRAEAEAVVEELVRLLEAAGGRPASLGVVAFSAAQQGLIENLLDERRREHPAIERFFGDEVTEPVFVKNLENVQGDERDVILFSICYGPDARGRVSLGFGPLNREGGERRLNVAITRARRQVLVFATLRPEQIDLSRTRAVGVRHLKTFLDYAARGPRAMAEAVSQDFGADFDSPFERDVHRALVDRGWQVDLQVGCSGYRIDLGVRDPEAPGRYLLGVECDGATYHSAHTARDRDRLRESVLRGLGWRLHRIWSSDWWHQRETCLERLEEVLKGALHSRPVHHRAAPEDLQDHGPGLQTRPGAGTAGPVERYAGGPSVAPPSGEAVLRDPGSPEPAPDPDQPASHVQTPGSAHPEEAPASEPPEGGPLGPEEQVHPGLEELPGGRAPEELETRAGLQALGRRLADRVLARESPVSLEAVCRRVAASYGMGRTGKRLRAAVRRGLELLPPSRRPHVREGFLWAPGQDPRTWRVFRTHPEGEGRKAGEIPLEELANAAEAVLQRQVALPRDDLCREVARLFGIRRLGRRVQARITKALDLLAARGGCLLEGDSAALPKR